MGFRIQAVGGKKDGQNLLFDSSIPKEALVSLLDHHITVEGDIYWTDKKFKDDVLYARLIDKAEFERRLAEKSKPPKEWLDKIFTPPKSSDEIIQKFKEENRRVVEAKSIQFLCGNWGILSIITAQVESTGRNTSA